MPDQKKGGLFYQSLSLVLIIYLFFKWGFAYISKLIIGAPRPLPIPSSAMVIYMAAVVIGILVYISSSEERIRDFTYPGLNLLRGGKKGFQNILRITVLVLFPILIGGWVFSQGLPSTQLPAAIRIQHPTIPGKYEKLVNPFRNPGNELVKEFIAFRQLGNVSMEEGKKMLYATYLEEGRAIYQENCHGCHGCAANGGGPLARGFLLKPVNFRDPGTITTIIEAYAFWRIKEGAPGLPTVSSPWDSPMPRWGDELSDDQIWKVILAIYDLADVEPRKPERLEH